MTPCMALEDFVDLKLGHYNKDGIEVVDVEGEIDVYTARGSVSCSSISSTRTTTSSS